MAAPSKVRPFFGRGSGSEVTIMDGSESAERIGRMASAIFIVLLVALFAYGYLAPLFAG